MRVSGWGRFVARSNSLRPSSGWIESCFWNFTARGSMDDRMEY